MAGRNWKKVVATSLSHAMELCLDFARERHNRSVDRVAELIGLGNKFTLYKWVESGKLPAIQIRPFEHACGCDFVTRYLAHSAGCLLVPIPAGRVASPEAINELQVRCSDAASTLIGFYRGERDAIEAVAVVNRAMEELAAHRLNAAKLQAPEFDFGL